MLLDTSEIWPAWELAEDQAKEHPEGLRRHRDVAFGALEGLERSEEGNWPEVSGKNLFFLRRRC